MPACSWNQKANSEPIGALLSHLVRVHQSGVWEVERGDEQTDTLTLYPVPIQVIGDDPGHKVLASAGPAVEGERQWLVRFWVVDKTLDGFQNHRLDQVLPVELRLKVPRQA